MNSYLLIQARELNINQSAAFEKSLSALVIAKQQQVWREQNKHSIKAYSHQVEANGLFGDVLRVFWWCNLVSTIVNAATREPFPYLLKRAKRFAGSTANVCSRPLTAATEAGYHAMSRLTPVLTVQGQQYLMMTSLLAGIAKRELGKEIESLADARHDIICSDELSIAWCVSEKT